MAAGLVDEAPPPQLVLHSIGHTPLLRPKNEHAGDCSSVSVSGGERAPCRKKGTSGSCPLIPCI
jgi:hypothetical protein